MAKSVKEKLQMQFLKELYKRGGCMDFSRILRHFYGMSEKQIMEDIVRELVEQKACVVEKNYKLIFITTYGLAGIKEAKNTSNWPVENLTYEKRCHGYSSVSEYYRQEHKKIELYNIVTSVLCRVNGYIFALTEESGRYGERKELLQDAAEILRMRCEKYDFTAEIHITVLKAVLSQLIEHQDKETFLREIYDANKLLDKMVHQRHRVSEEYKWYEF